MNDLKFAFRQLFKNPGFTAVAVLTLALGIGANSAIFSVVNGVLLKPLPYDQPGELVMVFEDETGDGRSRTAVAGGVFTDWKEQSKSFEALSIISAGDMNLTGEGPPERASGLQVSANYLGILRVTPLLGRGFALDEDQPGRDNKVVVITHELWHRRFGDDVGIINRNIRFDGEAYTVIGVLAPKALPSDKPQFLIPFVFDQESKTSRDNHRFTVLGRLKAGVSVEEANAELKALKQRLLPLYPRGTEKWSFVAAPLHEVMTDKVKSTLFVLLGAVGFVLMIACANVANLLLAKAASRHKEIAIRSALGASRWRVVRQVMTESVVLALLGGSLGVGLAFLGVDVLSKLSEDTLPLVHEISLDTGVLAFSLILSLLTGIAFGLVPAMQVSAPELNNALKEGGRGFANGTHNRIRGALIVSEVAVALVLLVGAGLLLKSFWRLWNTPTGFNPQGALALDISLPETKYPDSERRARFLHQVFQKIEALPGIEAASMVTSVPMAGLSMGSAVRDERRPDQSEFRYVVSQDFIAGNYFRAMGIPLLKGRAFTERDNSTNAPRTAVINDALVKKVFPNDDPVGKRIRFWGQVWEVVGVVGSVRHDGLSGQLKERIYLPQAFWRGSGTLVVRTGGKPLMFAEPIRREILALDSDQPVSNVRTLGQVVAHSVGGRRLALTLLGVFASVALSMAAIGLYGVMAFSVNQRTHEIGIRMALGARRRDVLKLVITQGMGLTLLGLAIGLSGSFALTRVIANQLYQVKPTDPLTFLCVTAALLLVALAACVLPARRATKVDPVEALRYE